MRTWHCSANLSDVCDSGTVVGQADIPPLRHPCYQPAPLRAPGKDEYEDRDSGLKSLLGGERDTDAEPSRRHRPHRVSFGHLWEHTISIGEPNEGQNESSIAALSSEKRSFQVTAQRAGPPSPALREEVIVSHTYLHSRPIPNANDKPVANTICWRFCRLLHCLLRTCRPKMKLRHCSRLLPSQYNVQVCTNPGRSASYFCRSPRAIWVTCVFLSRITQNIRKVRDHTKKKTQFSPKIAPI